MCEQQYFIEYVLGYSGPHSKASCKGTIVHKVCEVLGHIKLAQQEGKKTYRDDILGYIRFSKYDLDDLIEKCYKYYTDAQEHLEFKPVDFREVKKWTHVVVEHNGGQFDPRNNEVVAVEQEFCIKIEEDWAKYEYVVDGEIISGYLELKGTIDHIEKFGEKSLHIVDYKTGKRIDWATGEVKDLKYLQTDFQLRLYHYAICHLYPDVENIMATMFFTKNGGPFTMSWSRDDLAETKEMIKEMFLKIKAKQYPEKTRSWKCTKFCDFGKGTFQDQDKIPPFIQTKPGNVSAIGKPMCLCDSVSYMLENRDIDDVVTNIQKDGFTIGHYQKPGSLD